MSKFFAIILLVLSASAFADTTTTLTTPPNPPVVPPVNPGNGNSVTTQVTDTTNLNVNAISNMGGKSSPPPIPGAVVQSQFAGLFAGPAPDIETLALPLDVVYGHYCTGAIPADINTRLHKSDDEKGDSGKTRIVFEPRTANYATFADRSISKSSVNPIDLMRFDTNGRMTVYQGDREVFCIGVMNGKALIDDTDKTLNQTIENDMVAYLRSRGHFGDYLMVSVGFLTSTAPVAVYSTGWSGGASIGGSGMAETVARFLGITAGGSKNVGITGSTSRPEKRSYVFVDCTGKQDAQCTRMRSERAASFKLGLFGDQVANLFNPRHVAAPQADNSRIEKIEAGQAQIVQAIGTLAKSGEGLEKQVQALANKPKEVAKPTPAAPAKASTYKKLTVPKVLEKCEPGTANASSAAPAASVKK